MAYKLCINSLVCLHDNCKDDSSFDLQCFNILELNLIMLGKKEKKRKNLLLVEIGTEPFLLRHVFVSIPILLMIELHLYKL